MTFTLLLYHTNSQFPALLPRQESPKFVNLYFIKRKMQLNLFVLNNSLFAVLQKKCGQLFEIFKYF
jgi:hypothetical protein